MCVIIHAPAGVDIPLIHLKDAWDSNPHGAGFCYTTPGKSVVAVKGLMTYKQLMKRLKKHPMKDTDFTIHFRWATSGLKDKANTHPWVIGDSNPTLAVVHNGIFGHVKDEPTVSDTGVWTRDYLGRLHRAGLVQLMHTNGEISKDIGIGNKVVIHEKGQSPIIVHEDSGTWKDGVWYSNELFGGPFEWYSIRGYCGGGFDRDWEYGLTGSTSKAASSTNHYRTKADQDKLDSYWEELAWERREARELMDRFVLNEDDLSVVELHHLVEYLDNPRYYFPSMKDDEVNIVAEKVEWKVMFHLEKLKKESEEAKSKPLPIRMTLSEFHNYCSKRAKEGGPPATIEITKEDGSLIATYNDYTPPSGGSEASFSMVSQKDDPAKEDEEWNALVQSVLDKKVDERVRSRRRKLSSEPAKQLLLPLNPKDDQKKEESNV